MAKKGSVESTPANPTGFYKGYDINWLRSVKEEHPDGNLVDEFDALKEADNG